MVLIKKNNNIIKIKLCIEKISLNSRYFHEYFNDIFRSSGFFEETIVTPENSSSEILTCFENFIIVWIIREEGCSKRIKDLENVFKYLEYFREYLLIFFIPRDFSEKLL